MELFNSIGNIELKVRQLGKKNERLKERNAKLQDQNLALKEMQEHKDLKIAVIKDKLIQIQQRIEELGEKEVEGQSSFVERRERILLELNQCVEWIER